jgi:hypothetical protein
MMLVACIRFSVQQTNRYATRLMIGEFATTPPLRLGCTADSVAGSTLALQEYGRIECGALPVGGRTIRSPNTFRRLERR